VSLIVKRKMRFVAVLGLILLFFQGCITEFIPPVYDQKELVVVQGLITDQPGPHSVKLSKSLPLGSTDQSEPLSGCYVMISDDQGNHIFLIESAPGEYLTPADFHGIAGRSYTLHIKTSESSGNLSYESIPMEMKAVPPIDSVYYEKTVIQGSSGFFRGVDGCNIYLDTHDPENICKYFRWEYSETWVLRLLFSVTNQKCWISNNSDNINIRNTEAFTESRISRLPVTYISNNTDRLRTRYSILVNQYSLNREEFEYWEKLQKFTDQVGGLYDIIPASVQSNIMCIENPELRVLGFFSVSAKTGKRIYIDDKFEGIIDPYADCITDTIYGEQNIPGLNETTWTLFDIPGGMTKPRIRILTETRGCADCTVRGTTVKPPFWIDGK
jgi:hypothetical protein